MLELVKLALRITTTAFDSEILMLIAACQEEMEGLGVIYDANSSQIQSAVIAFCKWQFGENDQADRWESIYHEKLAQLKTMTGFTNWGGASCNG